LDLREDPLEPANRLKDPACRDLARQHRQAPHDWALVRGPHQRTIRK
jgi:hypothetical protein